MPEQDIRWMQRFQNFCRALDQLTQFVQKEDLNELEKQGLVKSFEYNYELAWNTIRDFYINQGESGIQGSRDAFRLAFRRELIEDGELWMAMIGSRNKSSHTYNESILEEIVLEVKSRYYDAFLDLREKLREVINNQVD